MSLSRKLKPAQQSPMAHAVIGGIITSTALTLVVVPVLFTYFDTLGRKVSARIAKPVDGVASKEVSPQHGD